MADGQRLDAALAERGLTRSRTLAAKLIADGLVTVDGEPVVKPSAKVLHRPGDRPGGHRPLREPGSAQADRGARRIRSRPERCARARRRRIHRRVHPGTARAGARRVIALDVGHGQLAPPVLGDPGVVLVEGENARELTSARLLELR